MLNLQPGDRVPYEQFTGIYHSIANSANIFSNGYNRWSHSAIRQWLNSDADAGEWWTSQHIGDTAPAQATTTDGFMKGLDEDFLNVVQPVKVTTATNTVTDGGVIDITYDRFFLPSLDFSGKQTKFLCLFRGKIIWLIR